MKPSALILLALLAISGCQTADQRAAMLAEASRPVTCSGQDDCEIKWGRAIQWVLAYSRYRIQVQTDQLIQTAGPDHDSPVPAFVISKAAQGGGVYVFTLQGGCDNFIACIPSVVESRAAFVHAVMDGPEAATTP